MASVKFDNLVKAYGNTEVLHGLNLDIEDGCFVVLLGPSGCGKSTLLRMLAGLEEITGGTVSIGERIVNDVHPKDRNIAMVFQNYALYAHMSVRENMAFSMSLKKLDKAVIEERVNWAAKILSLEDYLDRRPKELSGGQRQRVAMGRAIVRNPDVFLFDEPLSNLDAKLRVKMRTEIKELHQTLKTTTVYVTHDQIEAMTMADLVVVMRDGRIEQVGTPLDVYDTPANLFVAQFIGSPGMNIIEGIVGLKDGAVVLQAHGFSLPIPADISVREGQKILYGVRPEHLIQSETNMGIEAKITVVEPTGAETHIYASLAGQEICMISRERLGWTPESMITLQPMLDYVHIFDASSEAAITRAD